jgi:hypothetical protein
MSQQEKQRFLKEVTQISSIGQSTSHHQETKNVQFRGLQVIQNRVQEVRQSLLHNNRGQGRERADRTGADPLVRRNLR